MSEREERLRGQARVLGVVGGLRRLGVEEPQAWELAGTSGGVGWLEPTAELARALRAGEEVGGVLDVSAGVWEGWVEALLRGPRAPGALEAAGRVLVGGGVWSRLRVLLEGEAPAPEGLAALAREASAGPQELAEGLRSATRRALDGASWWEALRDARGFPPWIEAVFVRSGTCAAEEVLGVLEGFDALPRPSGVEEAGWTKWVEAASESTAPLRQGLDRLRARLEGALGLGEAAHAEAAREVLAGRRKVQEASEDPEAVEEPAKPGGGARKTIGDDSGPVELNDLHDREE